ncbi:hypothetical protein [Actinoplanes sp. NPDC026670]|uniref:hypothetical protein n=1 Tax=Actinoplanes sp. NPDC026670 TaxID=3154700 RepID=UPI0033D7E6F1
MLVVLLVAFAITRAVADWPEPERESAVLIGILVLALLPLLLILLGNVVSGGAVEAFGVRIEFAPDEHVQQEVVVSPGDTAAFGQLLGDSGTVAIVETLRASARHEVAVVDLEDGTNWWETRLLVLCAGAVRQARPTAIVFVASAPGVEREFKGWAEPGELLDILLAMRPDFRAAHERAAVAVRHWELASPQAAPPVSNPVRPEIAYLVFDGQRRRPYADEQILATELRQIEEDGRQGALTVVRLDDLFHGVLRTVATDLDATADSGRAFVRAALSTTDRFLAVTHGTTYAGLVLREQAVNDFLRTLLDTSASTSIPD